MGVAVKVTMDPWQDGFCEAIMETDTARTGFTTMVMILDAAGFPVIQVVCEEVRTQDTRSPFEGIYE